MAAPHIYTIFSSSPIQFKFEPIPVKVVVMKEFSATPNIGERELIYTSNPPPPYVFNNFRLIPDVVPNHHSALELEGLEERLRNWPGLLTGSDYKFLQNKSPPSAPLLAPPTTPSALESAKPSFVFMLPPPPIPPIFESPQSPSPQMEESDYSPTDSRYTYTTITSSGSITLGSEDTYSSEYSDGDPEWKPEWDMILSRRKGSSSLFNYTDISNEGMERVGEEICEEQIVEGKINEEKIGEGAIGEEKINEEKIGEGEIGEGKNDKEQSIGGEEAVIDKHVKVKKGEGKEKEADKELQIVFENIQRPKLRPRISEQSMLMELVLNEKLCLQNWCEDVRWGLIRDSEEPSSEDSVSGDMNVDVKKEEAVFAIKSKRKRVHEDVGQQDVAPKTKKLEE